MSREIKLRVWDITNQMWLKSFNANLLNVGDLTIVIISQYTEQKDDYGNEIFEDDFIIDVSEDGDYFLKLIGFGYDDREYSSILKGFKIVKGIQLDLYFDNKEGIFKGSHSYLLEKYKIKIEKCINEKCIYFQVIGNKHENPELLNLLEEKNG